MKTKCHSNKNDSDFLDEIYSTKTSSSFLTRLTNRCQTLINNIFSSVTNDDCTALCCRQSDHHTQILYHHTQLHNNTNSKKDIYKQNFRRFSSEKFITDLEKVNWDNTVSVFGAM